MWGEIYKFDHDLFAGDCRAGIVPLNQKITEAGMLMKDKRG